MIENIFADLFWNVLSNTWFVIPIILIIVYCKTPHGKGKIGEYIVSIAVKMSLKKKDYKLLNNITLPTQDGTTQIDHIIISRFGVFVIETKNMKGWIFGGEHQKQWTQQVFKQKNSFQNPIHQNYKHVKVLQEALSLDETKIFSIVVFVGSSEFKTEIPKNVFQGFSFVDYIRSKTEYVLSQKNVDGIIGTITTGRLSRSMKTNREHVTHVQEIKRKKANVQL